VSELLEPGHVFAGRYRIEKFLARGGFGAVYVAEQTEVELRVALKVLFPHILHSRDAVEKFKLEARVAGRVGSDHIVRVFDAGLDERTQMPFLVMELLQGRTLEDVVTQSGPIAPARAVAYLLQAASALDKAHAYVDRDGARRPIVHRDLKPENLFLASQESGDPIVKILDFGIAKVLSDSMQVSQEVKGTPLYMAYEQASAGQITPQTDIWALGLIAFFLLTSRSYWKVANSPEASLTQLFGEVLSLPIDPPSQRAAEIGAPFVPPVAFDAWFARAVNRDPAARFATAGECARALASVFGTEAASRATSVPEAFAATTAAGFETPANAGKSTGTGVPARSAGLVLSTGASLAVGRTQGAEPKRRRGILGAALGLAVVVILAGAFVAGRRAIGEGAVASEAPSAPVPAASRPAATAGAAPAAPPAVPPVAPAPAPPGPSAASASSSAAPGKAPSDAPRTLARGTVIPRKKKEPATASPRAVTPAKTSDTYTER
jgi:serine/threonine-protein kinase